MSGTGKSTLAAEIGKMLRRDSLAVALVDGDAVRKVWGDELGYSEGDRRTNMMRIARLCKYLADQRIDAVAAAIAPFRETREWNRKHIDSYYEVFITSPLESLAARDPKGLYKQARENGAPVPGVNQIYEFPKIPT
jgi:adenylylsulfate kinase